MPKTGKITKYRQNSGKRVHRLKKPIVLGKKKLPDVSEIKFQKLVEHMNEAVWMGDEHERTIYANPKFCELMEYTLEEMIGQESYEFWTPESAKVVRGINMKDRKSGVSSSYEGSLLTKSGKEIPVLLNGTTMPGGGTIGIMTDMREIRKKESHLIASKKLFDDLVQGSPIATFVINTDRKIVYWNKEMEKLSGMKGPKMIGTQDHWKMFYPKKRKMITDLLVENKKIKTIISHYDHFDFEVCTQDNAIIGSQFFKNVGGRDRWLRFIIKPMRDPENRIIGAIETVEDITERQAMSEALENRMREFQVLYQVNAHIRMVTPLNKVLHDVAKDITLACDEVEPARTCIVFDNKTYSNLRKSENFVISIEEPINVLGNKRGCIQLGYVKKTKNEEAMKLKFEKKVLQLVAQVIGRHVHGREITERYQKLVNKSVIGIYIMQNRKFQYVNPKFLRMFKYKEGEAIGKPIENFLVNWKYDEKFRNKNLSSNYRTTKGRRKDNSLFDIEVYTQRIEHYGKPAVLGMVKDITKIKEAERRMHHFNVELKEKVTEKTKDLQRANRRLRSLNELKDEFIAVTSHELRSPLTAVRGYLSFLMEKEMVSQFSGDAKEYLTRAYDNLEILNSLVNNILDVSRIETDRLELNKVPTDLAQLIKSVIRNLNFQLDANNLTVDFVNELDEKSFLLNIDSIRIRQVLRNILENATKYTPKGKKITIRISNKGIGVQISVEDQGTGIPKSQLLEIFDKFKQVKTSLKRTKGGAGLGLFIVKKIVELHGGMIWAESRVKKGTTFYIQLPIQV